MTARLRITFLDPRVRAEVPPSAASDSDHQLAASASDRCQRTVAACLQAFPGMTFRTRFPSLHERAQEVLSRSQSSSGRHLTQMLGLAIFLPMDHRLVVSKNLAGKDKHDQMGNISGVFGRGLPRAGGRAGYSGSLFRLQLCKWSM